MLQFVGKTTEGRPVVAGLFRLYETHGLPLVTIFEVLDTRGLIPDWVAFYHEARNAGVKADRILSMLSNDISDVYGREYRDEVLYRLERYHLHTST